MKLWWIDTETTGTKNEENGIIQIACQMEVDGAIVGEFESLVRPWDSCKIAEGALNVSGIKVEDLLKAPSEKEVLKSLFAWLGQYIRAKDTSNKAFLIGFNTPFDDGFLRALANRNGEKYLGSYKWPDVLDVRGFAALHLAKVRHTMKHFRLVNVAEKLLSEQEIKEALRGRNPHDALADVSITRAIWEKVKPQ